MWPGRDGEAQASCILQVNPVIGGQTLAKVTDWTASRRCFFVSKSLQLTSTQVLLESK